MSDVINNEPILEAVDQALNAVENQLDTIVETVEVVRNNPVILGAVLAGGLVVGGVGGYFIAKKRLTSQLLAEMEEKLEEQTEMAKNHYANINKVSLEGEPLTPDQVFEKAHGAEALAKIKEREAELGVLGKDYAGEEMDAEEQMLLERAQARAAQRAPVSDPVEDKSVEIDIKADGTTTASLVEGDEVVATRKLLEGNKPVANENWDYEVEKLLRSTDAPYVIHHDEFFENEDNLEMITVTWFEDGQTLVDDHDEIMDSVDKKIGLDNLERFGDGSKDATIVYIRNERLGIAYEVVQSLSSYTDMLGLDFDPDEPDERAKSRAAAKRRAFKAGQG